MVTEATQGGSRDLWVHWTEFERSAGDPGGFVMNWNGLWFNGPGLASVFTCLDLPQGATVEEIAMYIDDTSPEDAQLRFSQRPHGPNANTILATVNSAGDAGFASFSKDVTHTVDGSVGPYMLAVVCDDWAADIKLQSVRITYRMP